MFNNERSRIADDTLALYNLQPTDSNDDFSHRDSDPAGIQQDETDVRCLVREFRHFWGIFQSYGKDGLSVHW